MKAARPIIARPPPAPAAIAGLRDMHPLHARLYAMRGVTTAEQIDYALQRLAPITALEHIDEAARLVLEKRNQKIIVVGDFDVDGATSTALALLGLSDWIEKTPDHLLRIVFPFHQQSSNP